MTNKLPRILVFSGDARDCKTLRDAIGEEYEFQEVTSMGDAMRQCLAFPAPDAALVSYVDSEFDGRNFLAWMKGRPDTSIIPAIVIYESEWQARGGIGFLDGASDYVTKSFNLVALASRLRTLIELARFRSKQKDLYPKSVLSILPSDDFTKGMNLYEVPTDAKKHRILIVDDNEINREIAKVFLADAGFEVHAFAQADAAFQAASAISFDLVLTDLNMPGRDGYELSAALRKLPGYAETPILAMTASTLDEVRKRCLAAGIDGHVEKPADPEVMIQTVRKFLPDVEPREGVNCGDSGGHGYPLPDSIREIFAAVDGLDYEMGISYLGSKDLYAQLLGEFQSLHADDMVEMARLLRASSDADALRLVHTLKGLAGTLGLIKVQSASSHLERGMLYKVPSTLIDLYVERTGQLLDRLQIELAFALKKMVSAG
jgi:CheY-like chemotaxis protein/HPt (histidine-containing phosphotransfer) domain-containing protein